jgi:hypothetical protein
MELKFTDTYEATYPNLTDLRNAFSGKNAPDTEQKPYFQVFEERRDF